MPESITNSAVSSKENLGRSWAFGVIAFVRQNIRKPWLFWPVVIFVCMFVSLALDRLVLDLARRANVQGLSGDVVRTLESFKEFGQVTAIVVAFLLIFTLDKPRRGKLVLLFACIILPLLIVWPSKYLVHRVRPRHAEEYKTFLGLGFFFGSDPQLPSLDVSLSDKEKIAVNDHLPSSQKQSFPSAHTAVAFAFAFGLAALYPQARWVFYGLAIGCGFHRIIFGAHWLSDVVASVFISLLIAGAFWRWANKRFSRPELL